MDDFQRKVIDILSEHSPVWIVGGAVRDKILGLEAHDIDIVCSVQSEKVENILREKGLNPLKLGVRFNTISLFEKGDRIDIVYADDLRVDAQRRDFTINAMYWNPYSNEIFDPLLGKKDLSEKVLRTCGNPEKCFREDPVRILRMVKFAVQYQMVIEKNTREEAVDLIALLVTVSKERVTAELAEILILDEAETAIKMLDKIGYLDVFIPELARLKGIVQNKYHSLDAWEHTLMVFRNTPQDLFLRLAGLFHDIGKWEVASRECYLVGKLRYVDNNYYIGEYKVIGTKGTMNLGAKLHPFLGKDIKILGARLDHFPETVQFKRVLKRENERGGLTFVENGKRHFLNHEKASAEILSDILKRYSFSMYFDGEGKRREEELLKLVEKHMVGTLAFMPEFRGEQTKGGFINRAAELVWEICWDGRGFGLHRIHDYIALWKADYEAGKIHSEDQNQMFEKIIDQLITIALWQKKKLSNINWEGFRKFIVAQGLKGQNIRRFQDFIRVEIMKEMQEELDQAFFQKAYEQFIKNDKK